MSTEIDEAWRLAETGDLPGLMRHLRANAEQLPIGDLARLGERAAAFAGFDELVGAAAALAADPDDPQALYDFGYGCVERGAPELAVPALSRALQRVPDSRAVLTELAAALQNAGWHSDAVRVLADRDAGLSDWPERYLLAFNALLSGDLAHATRQFRRLAVPDDETWAPAYEGVRRMLDRAEVARAASALDRRDLRGWHFVLTGGVLATMSPYGFDQGMTGRHAFLQEGYGTCLTALRRLRAILDAAGRRPRAVVPLPDRSSRIVGLAAAELLGVPAKSFAAEPDTLVVAYDLAEAGEEIPALLRDRLPGQVLYEHATCWTEPPGVSADVCGLLHQRAVAPWDERMRQMPDGSVGTEPADHRPVEDLATEILHADPAADPGDGETPQDPDGAPAAFAAAVAVRWLAGPREPMGFSGPVPSSRFA